MKESFKKYKNRRMEKRKVRQWIEGRNEN